MAPAARAKWVRDRTERKLTPTVTKPLKAAVGVTELHAALEKVVDTAATPDLVPRGAMILQPSDERRRSGSHYTPRELTAPIVEKALEPVLEGLGKGGVPTAAQLLELKICDPAMGSGAFLVETCRYMAERLLESWKLHGGRPEIPVGEDEVAFAGRIVAQKCLYGVDRNPMAVDLAKMSLWLATLAKGEPLTFVDHALRDGDSLVGLSRKQIAAFTWERGVFQPQLGMRVDDAVSDAQAWRSMIRDAGRDVSQVELEDMWTEAGAALEDVRFYGDLAVEAFFLEAKPATRKKQRLAHLADVHAGDTEAHRERLAEKRRGNPPLAPFHWEIEFPEVFERENPGFDAFVGNPPFLGGKRISTVLGPPYRDWLAGIHIEANKNADVVAHFFRRAFSLLRDGGTFGLIATNTIAQGDTRSTGLRWICRNGGTIYDARTRHKWPGQAAVVVSIAHVCRGEFGGARRLDGREVEKVTAFLFHRGGHDDPETLGENRDKSFVGSFVLGMGFTFDDTDTQGVASPLVEMRRLIAEDPRNGDVILPYIGGQEVNNHPRHEHHRYVINFRDWPLRRHEVGASWKRESDEQRGEWLRDGIVPLDYPDPVAADWPKPLTIVKARVKPERDLKKRKAIRERWWHYADKRPGLYNAIALRDRVLATASSATKHHAFALLPAQQVFSHKLIVFPFAKLAAFCALQSRPHEIWRRFFGSTFGEGLTYNPSDVFETFPFSPAWTTDPALEAAGEAYYDFRADLMVRNGEGLTKTYNRFHDREERDPDIVELRRLHAAMDRAVLDAYGWTDIPVRCKFPEHEGEDDEPLQGGRDRYRWPNTVRDEVLSRLLELNAERAEEEEERRAAKRGGGG